MLLKSFTVYRFYQKELTPTVRVILVVTLAVIGGLAFVFSPHMTFKSAPHRSVSGIVYSETPGDQENLLDSEPLFLPTAWNYKAEHIRDETELKQSSFLPFGGVFYLVASNEQGGLALENDFSLPEIEKAFPLSSWSLFRTFGSATLPGVAHAAPAARIRVTNVENGTQIFYGFLRDEAFDDPRMLLSPMEVVCYDGVGTRQFSLMQSSGNPATDTKIIEFLRAWTKDNIKKGGAFSISVGR